MALTRIFTSILFLCIEQNPITENMAKYLLHVICPQLF